MRLLICLCVIAVLMYGIVCPPVNPNPVPVEQGSDQDDQVSLKDNKNKQQILRQKLSGYSSQGMTVIIFRWMEIYS